MEQFLSFSRDKRLATGPWADFLTSEGFAGILIAELSIQRLYWGQDLSLNDTFMDFFWPRSPFKRIFHKFSWLFKASQSIFTESLGLSSYF